MRTAARDLLENASVLEGFERDFPPVVLLAMGSGAHRGAF